MRILFIAVATMLMVLLTSTISLAQNETAVTNASTAANASALNENVVDVAIRAGDFNTLVKALQSARLNDTLSRAGPYTIFAPTDTAFAKIPEAQLNDLITNDSQYNNLRSIITYLVVPGRVLPSDLKNGLALRTMEGSNLMVTIGNGSMMVDAARIALPEINASNGVIYAIDTVLIPPDMPADINIVGAAKASEENTSGGKEGAEEYREAAGQEVDKGGKEEAKRPGM